jgi:protein-S-isoprenylcysteine O-methyltransferase Ste14
MYWQWRSMPAPVWETHQPAVRMALWALFFFGWSLAVASTFLIDHFDLFGLRQAFLYARGRQYSPVPFRTTTLYRFVRHPIMLGFLIAFWATPEMTWGHFLFSLLTTGYIFVGIQLEERDMHRTLGSVYAAYRNQVSMILPWGNRSAHGNAITGAPGKPAS